MESYVSRVSFIGGINKNHISSKKKKLHGVFFKIHKIFLSLKFLVVQGKNMHIYIYIYIYKIEQNIKEKNIF